MKVILSAVTLVLSIYACSNISVSNAHNPSERELIFHLIINKDNYLNSIYGESPQIAIWLEDSAKTQMKNVYVTYKSGKNDWVGKVYCKVALPYWQSRLNSFSGNDPELENELDAVTRATSKNDKVFAGIHLPENSVWKYFVEINVAGDYNGYFSTYSANGIPDMDGNGQPSVVYGGTIEIKKGNESIPKIIGRTLQLRETDELISDLSGITSAKHILSSIKVKVL